MNRKFIIIASMIVSLMFAACATNKLIIPESLSPAELIQRAQEASDRNRYNLALQYYRTLLERNPNDISLVCEAEYEIAFIKYKQKKYSEAKTGFHYLLERYDSPDEGLYPQHFKLLANKILEQITEKEKPLLKRKKAKQPIV